MATMRRPFRALPVVLVSVIGCGQSVPTCESACTTIGQAGVEVTVDTTNPASAQSTSDCSPKCTSDQATATADGRAADFQFLLTCIGNAGSFASECARLACGLTTAFGTPTGCTSDAGSPGHVDADTSASCIAAGGLCVVASNVECLYVPGSPSCAAGYTCCGAGQLRTVDAAPSH
jgi:hypothetical protein